MPVDERQAWRADQGRPLILALSGGGFRGYFTARVLAQVEHRLGAPCRAIFDLMAGTSIGGIVALALAHGVPAATIADAIRDHGPKIFPRLRFAAARRLSGPPYKAAGIVEVFRALLPDRHAAPLQSTSPHAVMVVSASPVTATMVVLRSWDLGGTGEIATIDAALATSAAPTYFPAQRTSIGLGAPALELVDGGIAANAPDALAIHHAVTELGFPENRIQVFSVGTCGRTPGGISGTRPDASGFGGALFRIGGSGIVELMMAIQEQRGVSESIARVGAARHLRIDGTPSDEQAKHLQLDNASPIAQRTLDELAFAAAARFDMLGSNPVWQLMTARAQQ